MRLIDKRASVLITDEGRSILSMYRDDDAPPGLIDIEISESEDLGLWIRVVRDTKRRLLLLRWEYVLALDVTDGPDSKVIGLKAGAL